MVMYLIYLVFVIAYFGGSLTGYGFLPAKITILTELSIYSLFILSLLLIQKNKKEYHFNLLSYYIAFIILFIASIFVNSAFNLRPIFSIRLILRFYMFYLALINLQFEESDLKKIINFLFIILILQLPASAIKFYFFGVHEKTIGTYAVEGGGLTTIIPIMAIGYLSGYYFLHKARKIYIFLAVGFILFGIVGAKAALFYLYPVMIFYIYYMLILKRKGFNLLRDGFLCIGMSAIIVIISILMLKYQPRFNPERKVGGSIDFSYALNYSKEYTSGSINQDRTVGRLATTKLVFSYIWEGGISKIFFGYGPGTLTKTMFNVKAINDSKLETIRDSYGITGFTLLLVEYGIFGPLIFLCIFCYFVLKCNEWYNKETDPYWKAFSFGSLIFAILIFFIYISYNNVPVVNDTIPPTFFFAMSMMFKRHLMRKENRAKG